MSTALLVIDVQNDFCPGGALAVENGDAVVPLINQLTSALHRISLLDYLVPHNLPPGRAEIFFRITDDSRTVVYQGRLR